MSPSSGPREGWLYFAGVIDLFSRRVVGWAMSASPDADLVIDALVMAFERRRPDEKPIHHSDRGRDLHVVGLRQAGRRSGHHPVVRLHRGLLRQLRRRGGVGHPQARAALDLRPKTWATRDLLRSVLFDYIEGFYNPQRTQKRLGYRSPAEFESAAVA